MSQKKALIVDDSTVTRMMIKKIILDQNPNYDIFESPTADEAKHLFPNHSHFDIITLDQNMPGTSSGLDLAEELVKQYDKTLIILITANVQDSIRNRAKSLGIDFLEKPITAEKLIPKLKMIK